MNDYMKLVIKLMASFAILFAGWKLLLWAGVLIGVMIVLALFSEER